MSQITVITTDGKQGRFWEEQKLERRDMTDCMHVVNVYPDVEYQTFRGFGGAFTEAAAHIYGHLSFSLAFCRTDERAKEKGNYGSVLWQERAAL